MSTELKTEGINSISLRPATAADVSRLFEWRDADETRRFFFDPAPLERHIHEQWLRETLARGDRRLLIGETRDGPVGVLRFDLLNDEAEISVYLVPGRQGRGLGTDLLRVGVAWAQQALPGIDRLTARIHPDNLASHRAFAKSGFRETFRTYEIDLTGRPSR